MTSAIETSFIGMRAAIDNLQQVGENIAKLAEDSDLSRDMVELSSASRQFEANARVAEAADENTGTVLDMFL